jgi:hypothetical protein
LKTVIPMAAASLGERCPLGNCVLDATLGMCYLLGNPEDLAFLCAGNCDDAIGIAHHDIAGSDLNVDQDHGIPNRVHLNTVLPSTHIAPEGKQGVAGVRGDSTVATDAVDDRPCKTPSKRDSGEDPSPHGRVGASRVIKDHDGSRRDLVDVVADCPWLVVAYWPVTHGERPPGDPCLGVDWTKAAALARDAQPIECV